MKVFNHILFYVGLSTFVSSCGGRVGQQESSSSVKEDTPAEDPNRRRVVFGQTPAVQFQSESGTGSGVVVGRAENGDVIVLTAAHVVNGAQNLNINNGGRIVALDPSADVNVNPSYRNISPDDPSWKTKNDLAVVRIPAKQAAELGPMVSAPIAKDSPEPMTQVNYYGYGSRAQYSYDDKGNRINNPSIIAGGLSTGAGWGIEAKDGELKDGSQAGKLGVGFVSRQGDSGGPLVNSQTGEVIGIVSNGDDQTRFGKNVDVASQQDFINASLEKFGAGDASSLVQIDNKANQDILTSYNQVLAQNKGYEAAGVPVDFARGFDEAYEGKKITASNQAAKPDERFLPFTQSQVLANDRLIYGKVGQINADGEFQERISGKVADNGAIAIIPPDVAAQELRNLQASVSNVDPQAADLSVRGLLEGNNAEIYNFDPTRSGQNTQTYVDQDSGNRAIVGSNGSIDHLTNQGGNIYRDDGSFKNLRDLPSQQLFGPTSFFVNENGAQPDREVQYAGSDQRVSTSNMSNVSTLYNQAQQNLLTYADGSNPDQVNIRNNASTQYQQGQQAYDQGNFAQSTWEYSKSAFNSMTESATSNIAANTMNYNNNLIPPNTQAINRPETLPAANQASSMAWDATKNAASSAYSGMTNYVSNGGSFNPMVATAQYMSGTGGFAPNNQPPSNGPPPAAPSPAAPPSAAPPPAAPPPAAPPGP